MPLEFNSLQQDIIKTRYAINGENWNDICHRVSKFISQSEISGKEEWEKEFYKYINSGWFIPAGRILLNAGTLKPTMLNCFVLGVDDTIESIGKLLSDVYTVSCNQGGIGINFSKIRPKGERLRGNECGAPGCISNMFMINEIGSHILSGGSRRIALLAALNVNHPDLLEFLHVKLDLNKLNNFNISVMITDEFLNAVKKNEDWNFEFNHIAWYIYKTKIKRDATKKEEIINIPAKNIEHARQIFKSFYKQNINDDIIEITKYHIKAKEIFDIIIQNAWQTGEPGILNITKLNNWSSSSYFEDIICTNPCGELPLPVGGSCMLGSINLSEMWSEEKEAINYQRLRNTIKIAVRFLDDVIELNHYPLLYIKETALRGRRIGMGVMGLAYLCIKAGLKYGSDEMISFLDSLFQTIRNEAYMASIELAKEKGAYPAFDVVECLKTEYIKQLPATIHNDIRKHGLRNANILTAAPTGTSSMLAGVSSGIEPIYSPIYKRTYRVDGVEKTEIVIDKLLRDFTKKKVDTSNFIGSMEISPEQHIKVQATIQKYLDGSLSKTINLPSDYPKEKLYDNIIDYADYVKGVTLYRAGSRGKEPLQAIPLSSLTEEQIRELIKGKDAVVEVENKKCSSGKCDL